MFVIFSRYNDLKESGENWLEHRIFIPLHKITRSVHKLVLYNDIQLDGLRFLVTCQLLDVSPVRRLTGSIAEATSVPQIREELSSANVVKQHVDASVVVCPPAPAHN